MIQIVYASLLLIITLCFICGEGKICSTIKKSQNIMNMIVGSFTHILAHSGIMGHNQTYSGIIQAYSKPWYIQNRNHIQNPVKHISWSILQKQLMAIIISEIYQLFTFLTLWHKCHEFFEYRSNYFLPEVFIRCKKVRGPRELGAVNFDIPVSKFTRWCIKFLKRLVRQIEMKIRSLERLLGAMRTFVMLNFL